MTSTETNLRHPIGLDLDTVKSGLDKIRADLNDPARCACPDAGHHNLLHDIALEDVPLLLAEVERLRAELELSEAGNGVLLDKLDRHRETSQDAVANVLQARLSWPQAEACARDLVQAGLIP